MTKIILASNRLPVVASREDGELNFHTSAGGLVSGVEPLRKMRPTVWVGWPGDTSSWTEAELDQARADLESKSFYPVFLSKEQYEGFYVNFSNGILWPLLHSFPSKLTLSMEGWQEYQEVSQQFAEQILAVYEPGDFIWIHDFQLMLLPGILREKMPQARIGYFLHVPFPGPELFQILPQREALLLGLLGADQIGFHTENYLSNFRRALVRILGIDTQLDRCFFMDGREITLGMYPMGIDVEGFEGRVESSQILEFYRKTREAVRDIKFILAIDRLDYTKGIPRRLLTFKRLLELYPELKEKVILIQIAVPSRSDVFEYELTKRSVDELVGQINGFLSAPGFQPIHYISQNLNKSELIALYRFTDIMMVTPLKDGMNLVAKEFCASRIDNDGILVLSEFAGAASEMGEALQVNPYDIEATAQVLYEALTMEKQERFNRMLHLRSRIRFLDNQVWSSTILRDLEAETRYVKESMVLVDPKEAALMCNGNRLLVVLDYDGTLVPFKKIPELSTPGAEILELLQALEARPDTELVLVSGRSRQNLSAWFEQIPLYIFAENGAYFRNKDGEWMKSANLTSDPNDWRPKIREVFTMASRELPGSFIEEKEFSLVWHYRLADHERGESKALALNYALKDQLMNTTLQIELGKKTIEVREGGMTKGKVIENLLRIFTEHQYQYVALGDDESDEEMFKKLPENSQSFRVGIGPTLALHILLNPSKVKAFLRQLAHRPLHSLREQEQITSLQRRNQDIHGGS